MIDSKNCEFVPRGLQSLALAYNYMPSLMFFVMAASSLLGYRKIRIMGRETTNLYPISSISAGPEECFAMSGIAEPKCHPLG